ncbi:MAG: Crp/Fnr family transcriptional regulator [Lachnospiraceae bacterium]|nr:Crp/Fnr family transcriptional regulator [Lachnospiraceae bacterium]
MSNYNEVHALIETLDKETKEYLIQYFKNAPGFVYDSLQIVRYPAGHLFIEQGSPVQTISILVKGIVKGTDYPILGAMYDFMWFDPVKPFGALEYLTKQPCFNASLMTACESTMLLLPLSVYTRWMETDINAMYVDASTTTNQLLYEIRRERIYIFMQGTERLAYFLILYYKQFETDGICHVNLTRQQICDSTGLSIRTVNRGITTLLEKNCLLKSGNKLFIRQSEYAQIQTMMEGIL